MKKLAVIGAVVLIAFVSVAWIRGGAQPMQWIEQPVETPRAGGVAQ